MGTELDDIRDRINLGVAMPENLSRSPGGDTELHAARSMPAFDFFGMLWRGKFLIILSVLCGLGIAYQNFREATPVYGSSARLLVKSPKSALPIEGLEAMEDHRNRMETHTFLLRSPRILMPAIHDGKLTELSSLSSNAEVTMQKITSGLTAVSHNESILNLNYYGADPSDCQVILTAVIDSYRRFLSESHESLGQETIELITNAKEDVLEKLQKVENDYATFRAEAPSIWRADTNTNVYRERLAKIEELKAEVYLKRTELIAEQQAIEQALRSGGSREALRVMVSKLSQEAEERNESGESVTLSPADQLWPMLLEEQLLLDRLGRDHRDVKTLRRKIDLTRQYLQDSSGTEAPSSQPQDFISVYLDSIKKQIEAMDIKANGLDEVYNAEKAQVTKFEKYDIEDEAYRNEIARNKQLFEAILGRLNSLNVSKDYGELRADVINPPTFGTKTAPNFPRYMTMGFVLGALAGVFLAFLRERGDRRFHSPEEVEVELGVPVLGHVPSIPPERKRKKLQPGVPQLSVCTYHRPKSQAAEAVRAIRTSLYFNTHAENHKILQVTSPSPGDGKSTLAANLAVSIANSGKRVLLLDADCRRPRVHVMFNIKHDKGLAATLAEENLDDPLRYVIESAVPNLFLLPCGERPDNPAELLSSESFSQFLELLRDKFDFVLVDSPPVLAVTDPSAVAARVDSVLVTARLNKNARALTTRTIDELLAVGARIVGIAINGVGKEASSNTSYKYSGSRYGYNYGPSSYGYGRYYESGYYEDSAGTKKKKRVNSKGE